MTSLHTWAILASIVALTMSTAFLFALRKYKFSVKSNAHLEMEYQSLLCDCVADRSALSKYECCVSKILFPSLLELHLIREAMYESDPKDPRIAQLAYHVARLIELGSLLPASYLEKARLNQFIETDILPLADVLTDKGALDYRYYHYNIPYWRPENRL